MNTHRTLVLATAILLGSQAGTQVASKPSESRRHVDLAICLDVSGSMRGLLDSARQSIWSIVNDLALAKPTPRLRIALLTYGNNGYPQANGWVKLETGLTQDLDLVSDRLFKQTLNGGTELVGRVLQASLQQLEWTTAKNALKLIIVAGNESADQDKMVNFREQCKKAISQGVMVNSIYCGNPGDNIAPGWKQVAQLAEGSFAAINQNGTIAINSPFDSKIQTLNADLNRTYIPLGQRGSAASRNQSLQDRNAVGLNGQAGAQRAKTKSTANYFCSWDLVDACKAKQVDITKVKAKDLPKSMQKMTIEERKAYVAKMAAKRSGIQKQILQLSKKRQGYVNKEMAKRKLEDKSSFEAVVRKAVRAQAEAKGLEFRKPEQEEESQPKKSTAEPKVQKR